MYGVVYILGVGRAVLHELDSFGKGSVQRFKSGACGLNDVSDDYRVHGEMHTLSWASLIQQEERARSCAANQCFYFIYYSVIQVSARPLNPFLGNWTLQIGQKLLEGKNLTSQAEFSPKHAKHRPKSTIKI